MGSVARVRRELVTVPRDVWERLLETIDALADEAELESIRRGLEDLRRGRVLSESEFLRRHPHLPQPV